MRRHARNVFLLLVLAAAVAPAVSGAGRPPALLPRGVTIGGVEVGGMRPMLAPKPIRVAFRRQLRLTYHGGSWTVSTSLLTGSAAVKSTVREAMAAAPGQRLRLPVAVRMRWVEKYVDDVATALTKTPRSARLIGVGKNFRPYITPAVDGVEVDRDALGDAIVGELHTGDRTPIAVPVTLIPAKRTRANFGSIIVIHRLSNRLYLFKGMRPWRSFPVATGQAIYPTPDGDWKIVDKQRDPWWYPPNSSWAKGAHPIPPGPWNPLGTRWMGLDAPGVGIHGTPDDYSIGYSASHGCIRMHVPEAEWLFDHVSVGTRVYIRDA
jgi:lipoprotein-anchoring transpeptidase ErfK/SrfK